MTSPTEPQKPSLRERISTRLGTDSSGRLYDADARHTRNVSWLFYGLIVVIVVVIVGGLAFGFWETNLKPLATVEGNEVRRGDLEDRQKLLAFRADRADELVTAALADGSIEADLANRRFSEAQAERQVTDPQVVADIVDFLFKKELAAEMGIELSEDELAAAVAADGSFPEARQIETIVVFTPEQEANAAATPAGIADARERAAAIITELEAGTSPEELAETYGPADYQSGFINDGDITVPAWNDLIFAAEEGGVTPITEAPTGEQLIAVVNTIVPEEADPGFLEAVNDEVGEGIHTRNVELETLADKLEQQVTDEALAAEYEQVELAEILIERSPATPDDTAGEVHASHILYTPETPLDEEGNPTELADLPEDDPAWEAAEGEAQQAADELSAVDDIDARTQAFADRARADSDGPSSTAGGDLGWFPEGYMVPEFNAALWDDASNLEHGDIIGPIRTQFGWHVILFDGFRSSLDVRLAEMQEALAADGADFAAIAAEYSDGPEAADGGDTGWHLLDEMDDILVLALSAIEVGEMTEPTDDGDGYRVRQKTDEGTRPLEADDAARLSQSAFPDWYDELYFAAEDEGRLSIDDSIYDE